ncbi:hypothetical protein IAT40_006478 [Kwoniella sp. CBS 6097]
MSTTDTRAEQPQTQAPFAHPDELLLLSKDSSLPKIMLYACGATMTDISANSNIDDIAYGGGPELTARELIENHVPEVLNIAQILIIPDIPEKSWIRVAQHFNEYSSREKIDIVGGVLICTTNGLEEVAFGLELTVNTTKPLILSGAMRPALSLSSDGPLNLYNSIATAISPLSRSRGVMVVMNGRIVSAYYVAKTNANTVDTFKALEQGSLGIMLGGRPMYYYEPARPMARKWFDVEGVKEDEGEDELPKVLVLYSHVGDEASMIEAAVESGAKGLIIAGKGIGVVLGKSREVADRVVATGIPVVVAARPLTGVSIPVLINDPLISSNGLNALQARIQLQLALATGVKDHEEIRELFESDFHRNIFKDNWGTAQRHANPSAAGKNSAEGAVDKRGEGEESKVAESD